MLLKGNGVKQLKETEAAKYGQELNRWLDRRSVLDGKDAR